MLSELLCELDICGLPTITFPNLSMVPQILCELGHPGLVVHPFDCALIFPLVVNY